MLPRIIISSLLIFSVFLRVGVTSNAEDCEKAETYFQKALEIKKGLSRLVKKEELYRKAIELCPAFAGAHNNLGDVYEKQGRFEEAIAEYKRTIELEPHLSIPYFGLGDIYYKMNRPKEAAHWYEKGLKYDAHDVLTLKRLAFIKDIEKKGVVMADTIRGMLLTTRGPGEVVSITFGEGLIPFDFDKYNIREDAKPQLNEIGKALKDLLGGTKAISVEKISRPLIEIAGHTDKRGTDEYNLRLSEKRAESVINYLVKNFNIPKETLKPAGYGERVPLCTSDSSEACHALNRRVEIVKKPGMMVTEAGKTRSVSYEYKAEPKVTMDLGFFYQKSEWNLVEVLREDSILRSRSDKYFIFFRPLQDCYVYILQEDSSNRIELLYPKKEATAYVGKGKDCWIPPFGNAFTLDDTKGEEKLYLVATSFPLESEMEGLALKDQVKSAVKSLKTRIIKVVKPSDAPEALPYEEFNKKPQKIEAILERVEGEGGWVKMVKFKHE